MLLACHSYVSVCTRMLRVCDSYVFVGTRIYPRVDRMLPVALVWCFSHDHAEWSSNFQLFSWSQRTGIRFLARGVGGCRLISFLFIFFLVLQWEYFQKLISTSEKMWSSAFRLGESVYYEQWYYFMNVYIIFCIYNVDGGSEIEPFFLIHIQNLFWYNRKDKNNFFKEMASDKNWDRNLSFIFYCSFAKCLLNFCSEA